MRVCLFVTSLVAVLSFLGAPQAFAHDARPVYVEITEKSGALFTIDWKAPGTLPSSDLPSIVMPASCSSVTPTAISDTFGDYAFNSLYRCKGGLEGRAVEIDFPGGNPSLSTLARVKMLNGATYSHIFPPWEHRWSIPGKDTLWSVAVQYTRYGIKHIFAGIDHLLFITALVFIARTRRRILLTVTGFTVAHSVTLALATLGIVTPPVAAVEASIALSIAFLAHEIVVDNKHSWTWRFPVLVSSSFGLLHGFGFASVLRDLGLPPSEKVSALLFFNVGVELGQLAFVALIATLFLMFAGAVKKPYLALLEHREFSLTGGYLIGIVGCFWLFQRLTGFV